MGSDTKSGPSIAAALHEAGLQDVAAAITPVFQCNAPSDFRTAVSIQQPEGNDGQQRKGEGLAAGDIRGSGGGALNIASTPMSLPPEITPSLNARGPSGANGHQFPVVDPRFSSVPSGSGTGATFGSNVGVARSPEFGGQGSGDFSINDAGGIDVSISSGGQPALTVDHGPHPNIEPLGGGKKPPPVNDPGGGGGGGGGGGAGDPDAPDDWVEDGPQHEEPDCFKDSPCDTTIDGTLCVTKIFADNLHLRWGTTLGEIKGPKKCGPVQMESVGKLCAAAVAAAAAATAADGTDSGDADADATATPTPTADDSGTGPDASTAVAAPKKNPLDLPPCPDDPPVRDEVKEDGAKDNSEPGEGGGRGMGGGDQEATIEATES